MKHVLCGLTWGASAMRGQLASHLEVLGAVAAETPPQLIIAHAFAASAGVGRPRSQLTPEGSGRHLPSHHPGFKDPAPRQPGAPSSFTTNTPWRLSNLGSTTKTGPDRKRQPPTRRRARDRHRSERRPGRWRCAEPFVLGCCQGSDLLEQNAPSPSSLASAESTSALSPPPSCTSPSSATRSPSSSRPSLSSESRSLSSSWSSLSSAARSPSSSRPSLSSESRSLSSSWPSLSSAARSPSSSRPSPSSESRSLSSMSRSPQSSRPSPPSMPR
jgi:hypothetical protein